MKVWICEEFDGDGWETFAVCKDVEACKKACLNHMDNPNNYEAEIIDTDDSSYKKIKLNRVKADDIMALLDSLNTREFPITEMVVIE